MSKKSFNLEDYAIDNYNKKPLNMEDYAVDTQDQKPFNLEDHAMQKPEPEWLSGLTGFNHSFDKLAHGLMSPLIENRFVPERFQDAFRSAKQKMNQNYQNSYGENPGSAKAGEFLGEQAASLPLYALGGGLAKYLPELPYFLKAFSPFLKGATAGGVGGGLHGALRLPEEGESRLENAATGAMGPAILGGALSSLGPILKASKGVYNAVSKSPIEKAEKIASTVKNLETGHQDIYGKILSKAKEQNIRSAPEKINSKPFVIEMGKKNSKYLRDFTNPKSSHYGDLEYAHKAQSSLGRLARNLRKKADSKSGISGEQRDLMHEATKMQKDIQKQIGEAFKKEGLPEYAKNYRDISKSYGENVIPYKSSTPIIRYRKGERIPEDFIKELANDKTFKALKGMQAHPEIYTGDLIKDFAAKASLPLAGGAYAKFRE